MTGRGFKQHLDGLSLCLVPSVVRDFATKLHEPSDIVKCVTTQGPCASVDPMCLLIKRASPYTCIKTTSTYTRTAFEFTFSYKYVVQSRVCCHRSQNGLYASDESRGATTVRDTMKLPQLHCPLQPLNRQMPEPRLQALSLHVEARVWRSRKHVGMDKI